MRNLFDFFVRHSTWFVFLFYVIVSCIFLFDKNPYQHHIYMTSAGRFSAGIYDMSHNITSYFNLRETNEELQIQNARLEEEVIGLKAELQLYKEKYYSDTMTLPEPLLPYRFIIASVINNSIHKPYNYITINKGSKDGIRPEMGVVDQNGIVGVVNIVGEHYSRLISLLNPNFRLSCKVKGNDAFGSLVWDGKDPQAALLEELPRHTVYQPGDTVITSGYSAMFPEGIPVGVVVGTEKTIDDNFYTLRVKLVTNFSRLSTVRVISSDLGEEIKQVEVENDEETAKTKF
ncbi:MAG: rod shape-determining protein MreC [Bacteroidales bacterium]|nr:rod shape-determining protein MreC [Bacteroidales bacterium]MBD5229934.1 rod shape-determining protein MreC [Bacteroidales bacterium]MBD5235318.1 rod shape-determining protein MreC [Barnesiella sp.]MBD5247450.1 rod shape-determining protein MreC [Barnesiella sp.]MBD5258544.1 rod shape-determining protein MreC [Barnesiella sp.]